MSPLGIGGFAAARALSTRNDDPATASRPWDKDRDGFVLGEGAGVMVLEEYEAAKARGAKIYAEVSGFGMTGDAYHMTAPNMDGPRRCMVAALRDAGVNADEVQYLNAHGTSTPLGDKNESDAVKAAFGEHAYSKPRFSTRSSRRVTALASMPYSRASSAAVEHLPTAIMNSMLACVPVMPSSSCVRCVTRLVITDFTRDIR